MSTARISELARHLPNWAVVIITAVTTILLAAGYFAVKLESWPGAVVFTIVCVFGLVVVSFSFRSQHRATRHIGSFWIWESRHQSLPHMKQSLEYILLSCQMMHAVGDDGDRWHRFYLKTYELFQDACFEAVVHQLEILDDEHQILLLDRLAERRGDFSFERYGVELISRLDEKCASSGVSALLQARAEYLKTVIQRHMGGGAEGTL